MSVYDYVVIGSGISGMSFAHTKALEGKKSVVLEKKDYAGGCVCTLRHEDFWLELGGHTIYNSYMTFIKILRELGLEEKFHAREKAGFKMYKDGRVDSLMNHLSKLEAAFNFPKMFFMKKDGKSVREYYSAVLGSNNYENMFQAMLQAVISQDASDFPADMLIKKRQRDKTAPKNSTLSGGMSSFIEAICDEAEVDIRINSEAVDIKHSGGIYTVETLSGEKFEGKNLVIACAPTMAAKLLENSAPVVAKAINSIKGVNIETLGVIVKKEDVTLEAFSFIIAKNEPFTSVVSRDIIPHDKYRGAAFHFRDGALDKEGKMTVIEDVLGIDRSSIVSIGATTNFSPSLTLGHKERIQNLDKAIADVEGLYIVGNYFGGLAIEDCMLRSMSEAGR